MVQRLDLRETVRFEYLDGPVGAARNQQFAVGRVCEFQDRILVRDQRIDEDAALDAERPDTNRLVETARGHEFPGRMQGDGVQPILRLTHRIQPLAGRDIPDFHGPVGGAGDESLTIGRERQRIDGVYMIFERANLLTGLEVTQLNQLVVAGGDDVFAVGRKRDGVNAIAVALNAAQLFTGFDIPDFDFARARRQPACYGEQLSIWRECKRANSFGVAGERGESRAG